MIDLRIGECLLENCAGGSCSVCKEKIPAGKAVQLSKWSNRIRHVECVPKSDTRRDKGSKIMVRKAKRKEMPE
jgi:hypothetical protein